MSSHLGLLLLLTSLARPASAGALADPTRPPAPVRGGVAQVSREKPPRLTSILVAPDRRLAVIDGDLVQVGDRVAGGRVLAIEPFSVRIGARGAEHSLHLSGRPVKHALEKGR